MEVSEALYGLLGSFEISLRNRIHQAILAETGDSMWFKGKHFTDTFRDWQRRAVIKAEEAASGNGRANTPSRLLCEFSLGFWTSLTAAHSEQQLWVPAVQHAFERGVRRSHVHNRLERIHKLRNRVAHHEPVIHRDGSLRIGTREDLTVAEIVEAIAWICPATAQWIAVPSRLERCTQRPNRKSALGAP